MEDDDDNGQPAPSSPVLQGPRTTIAAHRVPNAGHREEIRSERILSTPRQSRHRSRTGSVRTARSRSRTRNPSVGSIVRRHSRSRSRMFNDEQNYLHNRRHDQTRSRTRSRSSLRNDRLREELELERQRLRVLESQLRNERDRQELQERARHRDSELRSSRRSPEEGERTRRFTELVIRRRTPDRDISVETGRSMELRNRRRSPARDNESTGRYLELRDRRLSPGRDDEVRYDSTSRFFEEFLKVMKKQNNEQNNSFPVLNNVIPDFDPLSREQPITVWLSKVDECAEMYKWNDRQTIHYALPKLTGHAKLWYQGLPSLKRTWPEWKVLLAESFPATENYADLLTEMLAKRARFGESLELYYFSKINLLNRCKIFGREAIDCIIHGVDDRGVRVGAQAAHFEKTEQVLQFFKTIKVQNKENSTDLKKDRKVSNNNNTFSKQSYRTSSSDATPLKPRQSSDSVVCFNCKEKGHPCSKCPKPIVKCSYCHFIGHAISDCPKKATKPEVKDKSVMRVIHVNKDDKNLHDSSNDNTSSKYKMVIEINGKPIASLVDLGSETTLIRKSDAETLGLEWTTVNGTVLKGLGLIPYIPLGHTQAIIDVQGVTEKGVEIYIVDDHLINCSLLLGHSYTERPNVCIIKTSSELRFVRVDEDNDTKLLLKAEKDVTIAEGSMSAVRVIADKQFSGIVYVSGSVRGGVGSEYYLLPGEYEINLGTCLLLVQNLGAKPLTILKGSLVTRARYLNAVKHVQNVSVTAEQKDISDESIRCGDNLPSDVNHKLNRLLDKYETCFSTGLRDLGFTTEAEMVIQLKDSEPVVYRPYRMSHSERQLVQGMVDDMVECGIVRESKSPYASPIVLVHKKSGEKRLCVDYRALNNKTKRDHYPLPRIEDLLDQLSGQTVFTTLDLASGYHQIPIAEESIEKTAFVTPDGQYEYTRMPFGLANAPAVFQRVMHKVLAKIKYVVIYMDDILIPAASFEEGLTRLEEVLSVLQQSGLTLKKQKCNFFQQSIEFLGFEISKEGVKPGLQKVQAVSKFSVPTNQHDVRRFLGLASFFRRFVKDFALIARPLTSLLKKDTPWRWTSIEANAFESLQKRLVERPVLALYDHTAETQLHTDASKMGLAGILLQRSGSDPWRPVAYYSRQTTIDEQKLHSFELETLAVVSSLMKFRVYLLGVKFTIVTDCNALRSTFTKRDLVPRISRWWIQFLEYDCEVEYRAGEKMAHVDALSRSPINDNDEPPHVLDVLSVNLEDWITTVQSSDTEIKHIKDILQDPSTTKIVNIHKEYKLKNGRVYRIIDENTMRWVVPRGVRWQILKANHDDVGHFGFEKTLQRLKSHYWFPKMRRFTKKYVSACLECAHHKIPAGAKEGELHPIPKVEVPFHTVHADHLGPFVRMATPRANGQVERYNRTILSALSTMSHGQSPDKWDEYVQDVQIGINSTVHEVTKKSPNELLFGMKATNASQGILSEVIEEIDRDVVEPNLEEIREQARDSIEKNQEKNKDRFDRSRKKGTQYKEGDLVRVVRAIVGGTDFN
ncbi:uncharacterized protein LOC134796705 [Cydia splendana]|uniref:uncharacterized protein LOC134796705 n=1 Tax=Cydia splendana TaxID=1100963 RepID=UPI00300CE2BD